MFKGRNKKRIMHNMTVLLFCIPHSYHNYINVWSGDKDWRMQSVHSGKGKPILGTPGGFVHEKKVHTI